MRKSQYKRVSGKSSYLQWLYNDRRWICISHKWIRWAKAYMKRSNRRKEKQELLSYGN